MHRSTVIVSPKKKGPRRTSDDWLSLTCLRSDKSEFFFED